MSLEDSKEGRNGQTLSSTDGERLPRKDSQAHMVRSFREDALMAKAGHIVRSYREDAPWQRWGRKGETL